jgi:hypothetical protein
MENRETQVIEKSEENQASKESSLLSSAAAVRSHTGYLPFASLALPRPGELKGIWWDPSPLFV